MTIPLFVRVELFLSMSFVIDFLYNMLSVVSRLQVLSDGDGNGKVCVRTLSTLRLFISVLVYISRDREA